MNRVTDVDSDTIKDAITGIRPTVIDAVRNTTHKWLQIQNDAYFILLQVKRRT